MKKQSAIRGRLWALAAVALLGTVAAEAAVAPLRERTHAVASHVRWTLFPARTLHVGDALPPLAFTGLDGRPFELTPTGGATVVHVFATWCSECNAELPAFAAARPELLQRGVRFVDIDQAESAEKVGAFRQTHPLSPITVIDDTNVTGSVLGVHMIPSTYVVDAAGRLRAAFIGPMTDDQRLAMKNLVLSPDVGGKT
ncbi:MAG: TlpA family protein disulfide reductase [Candidatus Velthaea sp.]